MILDRIDVEAIPTREPSSLDGKRFEAVVDASDLRLTFTWHGGAYITVNHLGKPFEVINVWNAGSDTPIIARNLGDFQARVSEWVEKYDVHDVIEAMRGA